MNMIYTSKEQISKTRAQKRFWEAWEKWTHWTVMGVHSGMVIHERLKGFSPQGNGPEVKFQTREEASSLADALNEAWNNWKATGKPVNYTAVYYRWRKERQDMVRCKACNAEIKFIRTEKGRKMPVEVKPITVITSLGKTIKAFVPHWGNCSGASQFKK